MSTGTFKGQERDPLEVGFQVVVGYIMWVLGTEHRSPRAAHAAAEPLAQLFTDYWILPVEGSLLIVSQRDEESPTL